MNHIQEENITVPVNRKRFPLLLIVGMIILFLLFKAIVTPYEDSEGNSDPNLLIYIGVSISVLYYTAIALMDYIKTLWDRKATFVITEEGIEDNLSIFSCGKIHWDEVTETTIIKALNTPFLLIKVANPDTLILRQKRWKQRILQSYNRKWETPISQKRVVLNIQELQELLIKYKK